MKTKLLLSLFALLPFTGMANIAENTSLPYEESRMIKKSFAVSSSTSVEVINKYGEISVETWDKDSVRFEVTITAKASKLSSAKELFEMADVKFSSNSGAVTASLVWGENVNAFKRGTVEMTLAAGSSQVLNIDYKIYVPSSNVLKIENRFGNVFIDDYSGKVYVALWHGNLRAGKLKKAKNISVKYGDIKMKELKEGELEVSFGDIELEDAGEVTIHGSSGTIEIENAEKLNIEGTNEKLRIETVSDITFDLILSDIKIKKLKKKVNAVSKMGDLTIDYISANFVSADIYASGGDINLSFDPISTFIFEANLEKNKAFHASSEFTITDDDKLDTSRMIEGKKGNGVEKKLSVQAKSCSVYLNIAD